MMYKVMLVDDEVWVRRGLKEQIAWAELQVELVGEAGNGKEAYEVAMSLKPDIIISDIKMPKVDGLQFMEWINRDLPNTKMIVISGHTEFEFVQKSLELKAVNYILKPIQEKRLNEAIARAIQEIRSARMEQDAKRNMKMTLKQSLSALKETYLSALISHNVTTEQAFQRMMAQLNVAFSYVQYQFAVVQISPYEKLLESRFQNDAMLMSFSIDNIIQESAAGYSGVLFARNATKFNEYVLLFGFPGEIAPYSEEERVHSLLSRILDNLTAFLSTEIRIGCGRIYPAIAMAPASYNEASHALLYLKSQHTNGILFYSKLKKKESQVDKVIDHIHSHFSENLTLESVADQFHLNSSYLSRIFKAETGDNFTDFVIAIRMGKAVKLMHNPELKTYEIGQMVGYDNANHFSKIFRKHFGVTPTEYRRNLESK